MRDANQDFAPGEKEGRHCLTYLLFLLNLLDLCITEDCFMSESFS